MRTLVTIFGASLLLLTFGSGRAVAQASPSGSTVTNNSVQNSTPGQVDCKATPNPATGWTCTGVMFEIGDYVLVKGKRTWVARTVIGNPYTGTKNAFGDYVYTMRSQGAGPATIKAIATFSKPGSADEYATAENIVQIR